MNQVQKQSIQLAGVAQTLLYPLIGRAHFSGFSWSPVQDEYACKAVQSIDYDFDTLLNKSGDILLFFMARAYQFDTVCKAYLKQHPTATIVSLGAGLETAFYRVDNSKLTWIDLDFPDVIALRKKLLVSNSRVHYIEKSVFDFSWMDDVKQYGDNILFLAGGFFIYFTPEQVKLILTKMANEFPSAELMFDCISTKAITGANQKLQESHMGDAKIQWPLDDATTLEKWSSKIQLISQFHYFKNIKIKQGIPLLTRLKMFFYDLADKPCCVHLKFTNHQESI